MKTILLFGVNIWHTWNIFFSAQLTNTEIEDMENNLIGILGVTSELGIMQLIMIYSFEHLYKLHGTVEIRVLFYYFVYFKGTDVPVEERSLVSSAVYIEPNGKNWNDFWKLFTSR